MDMEKRTLSNKRFNPLAFVPSCIVYPKVDDLLFETINDSPQHLNKTIRITTDPLHNSVRSMNDIHPTKDIQSLPTLTPGVDKRTTSFLHPYSPKFRVKRKSRFIFKKNHSVTLTSQRLSDFFLTSREILPLLLSWPERNGKSAVSENTPTFLSVSGHGEREYLRDVSSLNTPQRPHRPIVPWESRNPG